VSHTVLLREFQIYEFTIGRRLTSCSGLFVYAALNGLIAAVVWVSGGRIEPSEYDLKEYWSWKGQGKPPWFVRAAKRGGQVWKHDGESSKHGLNAGEVHESSFDHSRRGSSDNKDGNNSITMPERVLTSRGQQ
jgi:adenine/guanine/hypoxanthine permease